MGAEVHLFHLRGAGVGEERAVVRLGGRRDEEDRQRQAGRQREPAGRGEGALVRAPQLAAVGGDRRRRSVVLDARHHAVGEAGEVRRLPAGPDHLAQRQALRCEQRLAAPARRAAGQVIVDPGAIVVGQRRVEQRPEQRDDFLAALHDWPSFSGSGASSPRYSRSLFCIFNRAWKRRLITVPLRMPSTLASSS